MIILYIEINELPDDKIKTVINVCHDANEKPSPLEKAKADAIREAIKTADPEDYDLISNTQIDYDKPKRIT